MQFAAVAWPDLAVRALTAELPRPLGELPSPEWLAALLVPGAVAPLRPDEALRTAVRDLLRRRGYKPTGRGKPSSEYLVAAATAGRLGRINAAVDAGNVASLHSGLPISVVDLDRMSPPLRVDVPGDGEQYVFNNAGQTIFVGGLPCLYDGAGPCANAVKDAQRTKTSAATTRVLAIVWGTAVPHADRPEATAQWLQQLLVRLGAKVDGVAVGSA
ncbi:MAG TPA: phenylalanine--tRNA ligase beta subunit-related protein [Planctomycetota bacterium]|nr:phenylalanine--tRNA ligase beta subunit-related protein [Planctomycetota bacterium]